MKRCSFVLCALLPNQRHSSTGVVPTGQPASQPPRILHILDFWKSSFSKKKKKFRVSSSWVRGGHAEGYFLCSPWTSVNKNSSQPLPNMSWFVLSKWGIWKKKEEKEKSYKLTSAISSFLPMLCLKYRACFHTLYAEESDICSHLNDLSDSIHIIKLSWDQFQQTLVAPLINSS